MARKRGMVGKGAERVNRAVSDMDQDMRALRRAFKAVRQMSPEALRLVRVKLQRM